MPGGRTLADRSGDSGNAHSRERPFVLTVRYDRTTGAVQSNLGDLATLLAEGWVVTRVQPQTADADGVWGIATLAALPTPTDPAAEAAVQSDRP
jgi:hypothetical protein